MSPSSNTIALADIPTISGHQQTRWWLLIETPFLFFGGFFICFIFKPYLLSRFHYFKKATGSRNEKSNDTHTEWNSANIAWKFSFSFCMFSVSKSFNSLGRDRVTHICVVNLTIIGSNNDLSPDRSQAILWTNAGILLFWPLGTNFSET